MALFYLPVSSLFYIMYFRKMKLENSRIDSYQKKRTIDLGLIILKAYRSLKSGKLVFGQWMDTLEQS